MLDRDDLAYACGYPRSIDREAFKDGEKLTAFALG